MWHKPDSKWLILQSVQGDSIATCPWDPLGRAFTSSHPSSVLNDTHTSLPWLYQYIPTLYQYGLLSYKKEIMES